MHVYMHMHMHMCMSMHMHMCMSMHMHTHIHAHTGQRGYPRVRMQVHLVNVAYNSIFIGEIALPDWDMFHSKHEVAALHAAARAVGGRPACNQPVVVVEAAAPST